MAGFYLIAFSFLMSLALATPAAENVMESALESALEHDNDCQEGETGTCTVELRQLRAKGAEKAVHEHRRDDGCYQSNGAVCLYVYGVDPNSNGCYGTMQGCYDATGESPAGYQWNGAACVWVVGGTPSSYVYKDLAECNAAHPATTTTAAAMSGCYQSNGAVCLYVYGVDPNSNGCYGTMQGCYDATGESPAGYQWNGAACVWVVGGTPSSYVYKDLAECNAANPTTTSTTPAMPGCYQSNGAVCLYVYGVNPSSNGCYGTMGACYDATGMSPAGYQWNGAACVWVVGNTASSYTYKSKAECEEDN